jgi:hypothetical protein
MIYENINLRQLNHALMVTPKGVECIVIPIIENNLFKGEKVLTLSIVGFEFESKQTGEYKDTHLLKQSFSKEKLAAMTDEEKRALPILGNARVTTQGQGYAEPEPKDLNKGEVADSVDSLPF